MSGFVEKLFDSFTGQNDQNQQQQQSQPQLPPGWISQWDDREQRYIYINESTGERSWEVPQQGGFLFSLLPLPSLFLICPLSFPLIAFFPSSLFQFAHPFMIILQN